MASSELARVIETSRALQMRGAAVHERVLTQMARARTLVDQARETKRQVLKPGQKLNLLKLGEGPFPLPIGQSREDVLKMFDVKKVDAKQGDPQGTVHLELAPKPNTDFARKFKTIDVWVETKTSFPRRIATVDKSEAETRTTDLTNIQVNVGLKDDAFVQEKIEGWTQKSEQME